MKIEFKIESYYKEDEDGKIKELYKLEATYPISDTHYISEEGYWDDKERLQQDIIDYLENKIYVW